MTRLRRSYAIAATFAIGLIGCELLVSSSIPSYKCTPGVAEACPSGMACDPNSLACTTTLIEGGPPARDSGDRDAAPDDDDDLQPIGAACDTTKACRGDLLCGTSTILTTTIVTTTEAICTKTCCTSSDCPESYVCFGSGTGGNYCVSAERAKRTDGLGARAPGETCAANADCRSGVCADERCLDLCCKETDCTGDTTCRVKSISTPPPARENWVCATPEANGTLVTGAGACGGAQSCRNDNCAGFPLRCRPPCCSSSECPQVDTGNNSRFAFCAYGSFEATQAQTKWCFNGPPDASAPLPGAPYGAACSNPADCAERFCDRDTNTCGRVCCRDADCPDDDVCQPQSTGAPLLRCVKARQIQ